MKRANRKSDFLAANLQEVAKFRSLNARQFGLRLDEMIKRNPNLRQRQWTVTPGAVRNWFNGHQPSESRFTALALFILYNDQLATLQNVDDPRVHKLKSDIFTLEPAAFLDLYGRANGSSSSGDISPAATGSVSEPRSRSMAAFVNRDDAAKRMLEDIGSSKRSCWISAAVYVDQLIKVSEHHQLVPVFEQAASNARRDGESYRLTYCSLSGDTSKTGIAGKRNAAIVESWCLREKSKLDALQSRIKAGSEAFEELAKEVRKRTRDLLPERRFFRDYLVPHALVVIDDSIAYVALYDWATRSGRQSITFRFDGDEYASRFVQERDQIRKHYSFAAYSGLAFDFDGTIADSMKIQEECWCRAADTARVGESVKQQLVENLWAGAAGNRMFDKLQVNAAERSTLRTEKDALFGARLEEIKPFDRCAPALKSLHNCGHYKLAIATTATKGRVQDFLRRYSLSAFENRRIKTDDDTQPKPAPDMIEKLAKDFQCEPWQLCLIGDSVTDFEMSRNAGCGFVLFRSNKAHKEPVGCVAVDDWDELLSLFVAGSYA